MKYCTFCGERIPSIAKYCEKCGKLIEVDKITKEPLRIPSEKEMPFFSNIHAKIYGPKDLDSKEGTISIDDSGVKFQNERVY